jgi:signal transduction histidine kinase
LTSCTILKVMDKSRQFFVFTLLLAVGIVVFSLWAGNRSTRLISDKLIEQFESQELLIANQVARTFELEVRSIKHQLMLMAQFPEIRDAADNSCQAKLEDFFVSAQTTVGNLGRVGADGYFKCSLNRALIGSRAENLGPYIKTIFNDPEHKPVMSRAIKPTGASSHLVAMHVPVLGIDGSFQGTLGGAIYFDQLQEKYLKRVALSERGFISLYDDDGTILYRPEAEMIGKNINSEAFAKTVGIQDALEKVIERAKGGETGTVRYTLVGDVEKLASFVPVSVLDGRTWVVVVSVPISDIRTLVDESGYTDFIRNLSILLMLAIFIVTLVFWYVVNRWILIPIRKIDEMKSDFVSLVSHQLKTPAAQIKGYAANMLDGITGPLTKEQRVYLTNINRVADRNAQLIDDLLDVSRLERGLLQVNIEPVTLSALMKIALAPVESMAEVKGVSLEIKVKGGKTKLRADIAKTPEAVRNIIDNAVKFTPPGKKVVVETKDNGAMIEIVVTDQGPGIDAHVQTELFEKNRVWSGRVQASGAGLGLFLSKRFIELGGGSISFKTGMSGTLFSIRIPKHE